MKRDGSINLDRGIVNPCPSEQNLSKYQFATHIVGVDGKVLSLHKIHHSVSKNEWNENFLHYGQFGDFDTYCLLASKNGLMMSAAHAAAEVGWYYQERNIIPQSLSPRLLKIFTPEEEKIRSKNEDYMFKPHNTPATYRYVVKPRVEDTMENKCIVEEKDDVASLHPSIFISDPDPPRIEPQKVEEDSKENKEDENNLETSKLFGNNDSCVAMGNANSGVVNIYDANNVPAVNNGGGSVFQEWTDPVYAAPYVPSPGPNDGPQYFQCATCLQLFETPLKRDRHQRRKQCKFFECEDCIWVFYSYTALKLHQMKHGHGQLWRKEKRINKHITRFLKTRFSKK